MSSFKPIVYKLSEIFTQVVTSSVVADNPFFNALYVWSYFKIKSVMEKEEREFFRSVVQPGMSVCDIGANIGFFTVEFSRLVGREGRVYAFEPDPFIFSLLRRNIERFNCTNVVLYNVAVSDRTGHLDFYVNARNRADNRSYASEGEFRKKISVESKPLDGMLPEDSIVDFIKMDIQGFEPRALQGMMQTISRSVHCTLFSEFWPYGISLSGYRAEKYLEALSDAGFHIEDAEGNSLDRKDFEPFTGRFPRNDFGYANLICKKQ